MSKNLLNNLVFIAFIATLVVHPGLSSRAWAEDSSSQSASSSREIKRFTELARQYRDWMLSAYPSLATYYGIHKYDTELEDLSDSARKKTSDSLNSFYKRFSKIDFASLNRQSQIDWNLVVGDIKSKLLELETIQSWKVNPDIYSSSANSAVFNLVNREFAPLEKRLVSVIARESKIPQLLAQKAIREGQ